MTAEEIRWALEEAIECVQKRPFDVMIDSDARLLRRLLDSGFIGAAMKIGAKRCRWPKYMKEDGWLELDEAYRRLMALDK